MSSWYPSWIAALLALRKDATIKSAEQNPMRARDPSINDFEGSKGRKGIGPRRIKARAKQILPISETTAGWWIWVATCLIEIVNHLENTKHRVTIKTQQ